METLGYIGVGVIAAAVFIGVGWRFSSRRRSLPCPVWLRWLVELDNPFAQTNRAAFIVGHLGLAPGMAVLDAGCGPGRLTLPAARAVGPGGEVVALDIQPGMLACVREKARAAGLTNICFLQAGLGEGRIARGHFDRALLVMVLGEIPDQRRALQELFDALRPGGLLSVTEILFDPHFQRRQRVTESACGVGFQETAFFGNRIAFTLHLQKPYAH